MITEKKNTTIRELSKSQNIRLLDVLFIAPFLLYIGYKSKGLVGWERLTLYLIAGSTFYYNGKNYLKNRI